MHAGPVLDVGEIGLISWKHEQITFPDPAEDSSTDRRPRTPRSAPGRRCRSRRPYRHRRRPGHRAGHSHRTDQGGTGAGHLHRWRVRTAGLFLNSLTCVVSGRAWGVGVFAVEVTATDSAGAKATAAFRWTVSWF
ncbi:Ig domain-containing protein [Embleya sp. NPDC005575]|uniref:Ig domain-containing protein n=1 Tax=Embleya sp. NPDC005575 TaxID=3156892 RepID=UPI0033BEAC93